MIKALLLDFNGVIINDEPIQMRAYQQVLADAGVELTENEYYSSLGMDDLAFVRAAYERKGKSLDDATAVELINIKTAKWIATVEKEVPLFEGITNFIEKMSHDFTLGLVSMARRSEICHVLERADLGRHLSAIVSAEDVSKCKPDPECF